MREVSMKGPLSLMIITKQAFLAHLKDELLV